MPAPPAGFPWANIYYLLLVGHAEQSISVASWSGLLNRQSLDWDDWLLEQIGLKRESLPALVDAYDGVHGLKPEFCPALARPEGRAVVPVRGRRRDEQPGQRLLLAGRLGGAGGHEWGHAHSRALGSR